MLTNFIKGGTPPYLTISSNILKIIQQLSRLTRPTIRNALDLQVAKYSPNVYGSELEMQEDQGGISLITAA
jgi:hypothetical protein|uniref:Uncharacterized protein n=1 Tax=Picea glauca TaxID=3330 RepID=A0A124GMF2_PICGL|nr:hypothetical protein ABT39_MTgene2560 [Picea glauca]